MEKEIEYFKNKMESLSDEELIRIVKYDYKDYTDVAINAANQEVNKRNIDLSSIEEIAQGKSVETEVKNYAGFWKRLLAHIIDGIFIQIVVFFIIGMFGLLFYVLEELIGIDKSYEDLLGVVFGLSYLTLVIVFIWLYSTLCESSKYQGTLGKMLVGIIVTDMDGNRISFGKANARFWSKILSKMTINIGYLITAFTKKKQALHDLVANTLVLRKVKNNVSIEE